MYQFPVRVVVELLKISKFFISESLHRRSPSNKSSDPHLNFMCSRFTIFSR